jgi:hypothetical protein
MVERALRRLHLLDGVLARRAQYAYAQACGRHLLKRTRPEYFARGVLTVRVESAAWANELTFVREDLLRRIREQPGGACVRDLRFHVGPLEEVPPFFDEQAAPEVRLPPQPLDPNVAAALTQVHDDELRDALGALYVRACRVGKRS